MAKQEKPKGRADGLKVATFTLDGKKYFAYGHTKAEAKEKAEQKKRDLKEKRFKRSADMTFSEYYARWAEAREGTVKGSTLRKQKFEAEAAAAVVIDGTGRTFGELPLSEVEVQHIRVLQKALLKGTKILKDGTVKEITRTAGTVNDIIAFVSHVFHDAVNERAIDWNPCTGVKDLKRTEKPARETIHRALTKEETAAFFTAAGESAYYWLYKFLISTGARVGEAAALTVQDIKPDGVQIRRTVTKTADGSYTMGDTTKTAHGKRFIPMTPAIREAVTRQREINAALYGDVVRLDDTIFKTAWGNMLMAANVDRDIARICKKAGLEKFTAHAFRDTFATRALESGMHPKTLQDILGHADFSTTMNTYAHSMESTRAEEMQKIAVM